MVAVGDAYLTPESAVIIINDKKKKKRCNFSKAKRISNMHFKRILFALHIYRNSVCETIMFF